jgi:hypothetical protein
MSALPTPEALTRTDRPITTLLERCLYRVVTERCGGRILPFGVRQLIKDFAFVKRYERRCSCGAATERLLQQTQRAVTLYVLSPKNDAFTGRYLYRKRLNTPDRKDERESGKRNTRRVQLTGLPLRSIKKRQHADIPHPASQKAVATTNTKPQRVGGQYADGEYANATFNKTHPVHRSWPRSQLSVAARINPPTGYRREKIRCKERSRQSFRQVVAAVGFAHLRA